MALNLFHDNSIPKYGLQVRRAVNCAAIPGGANDATFYTAFSSQMTQYTDPSPSDGKSALDNGLAYGKSSVIYGLAALAVIYVIYRS